MPHLSFLQVISFIVCTIALTLTYSYLATTPKGNEGDRFMTTSAVKNLTRAMSTALSSAKIIPRRSADRGHADHGWLNSYHTFSFADYYDPQHESFGALRVLNEDRVAPGTGFPTHPHRDAEIFSYILTGQLTHRDSMTQRGTESKATKDQFYRMERGDVQFTTGGTGIAHSEQNEHTKDWVHFLQIWALPWKRGLKPTYHTSTFAEPDKRKGFVPIISPLKAGPKATAEEESTAVPTVNGTIPVHADLVFSAGIIPEGRKFEYKVGDGRDDAVLSEGDGAYISNINAGEMLSIESVGQAEAEVVVLDSN